MAQRAPADSFSREPDPAEMGRAEWGEEDNWGRLAGREEEVGRPHREGRMHALGKYAAPLSM